MVNEKQHTIRFRIDDLLSPHIYSKVNDLCLKFLNKIYVTYGEVQSTRVKVQEYLGIDINFSDAVKEKIGIVDYIGNIINKCPKNITGTAPIPEAEDLFSGGNINPPPNDKYY